MVRALHTQKGGGLETRCALPPCSYFRLLSVSFLSCWGKKGKKGELFCICISVFPDWKVMRGFWNIDRWNATHDIVVRRERKKEKKGGAVGEIVDDKSYASSSRLRRDVTRKRKKNEKTYGLTSCSLFTCDERLRVLFDSRTLAEIFFKPHSITSGTTCIVEVLHHILTYERENSFQFDCLALLDCLVC